MSRKAGDSIDWRGSDAVLAITFATILNLCPAPITGTHRAPKADSQKLAFGACPDLREQEHMKMNRVVLDKKLRRTLVDAVRCQIFKHHLDLVQLREGLEVIVASHMAGFDHLRDIPDLNAFIATNKQIIDAVVIEAIERGQKQGPR